MLFWNIAHQHDLHAGGEHPDQNIVGFGLGHRAGGQTQDVRLARPGCFEAIQAQLSDLSAVVQEALAGVRVVRAYRQEAAELERFATANTEYVRRNLVLIRLQGMFYPSLSLFLGLGALLVAIAALPLMALYLLTARILRRAGVPHPRTWLLAEGIPSPAPELPVVLKPRFGSWGQDVLLARTIEDLAGLIELTLLRLWVVVLVFVLCGVANFLARHNDALTPESA